MNKYYLTFLLLICGASARTQTPVADSLRATIVTNTKSARSLAIINNFAFQSMNMTSPNAAHDLKVFMKWADIFNRRHEFPTWIISRKMTELLNLSRSEFDCPVNQRFLSRKYRILWRNMHGRPEAQIVPLLMKRQVTVR